MLGYDNVSGYNADLIPGVQTDVEVVKAVIPPLLEVKAWDKTPSWAVVDSGTTTSTVSGELVDSGATFISSGVLSGMIVRNTTDSTFAIVDSVDSETEITLRADVRAGSSNADIFTSGEAYTIYLNFELSDGWAELNGQTISDADSPWNGKTLPNRNNGVFLRGNLTSSTTGGSDTHNHQWADNLQTANLGAGGTAAFTSLTSWGSDGSSTLNFDNTGDDAWTINASSLPSYFEAVWIMRIK